MEFFFQTRLVINHEFNQGALFPVRVPLIFVGGILEVHRWHRAIALLKCRFPQLHVTSNEALNKPLDGMVKPEQLGLFSEFLQFQPPSQRLAQASVG